MTGLTSLGWTIHDHLKEHRPKMFNALKVEGRLNATVLRIQTDAHAKMDSLEKGGLYPHEAWEIVKDDVLLPSEEDVPLLGETRRPYCE
jgi:hypothetical protein